jgi:pyridoxamine 5'-phosphate oxidase
MNLDLPNDKTYQQNDEEEKLVFAPATYQYTLYTLNEDDLNKESPIEQFDEWFEEAVKSGEDIPESTVFSTASLPSGRISSRVVLLKELDKRGFLIFSNWDTSKKEKDFQTNKYASLTFLWKKYQRQVRIEGIIEKLSYNESEEYYNVRPRGSKIGAWASPQSKILKNRKQLEQIVELKNKEFENLNDDEIKCPPRWGGIRIVPLEIEFWQGRQNRLHDRLSYRRDDINSDKWEIVRLAP